jgi:Ca-dependent carbohydrate-binding module xylan-binding
MIPIKRSGLIFLIIACFASLFFCFAFFHYLPSYFTKTKRIKTDTLVVEGWISQYSIEQAYQEFITGHYHLLITTGGPYPDDFEMYDNGKLVFEFNNVIPENISVISVNAFGDMAGDSPAHFKIEVNDSLVGESFVTDKIQPYTFIFNKAFSKVRKVDVIFDNDFYISPTEDRNLHILSIRVGNKEIIARNDTNYYCKGLNSNEIKDIAYSSQAYSSLLAFKALGINSNQIIGVPAPKVNIYRTKNNARALLDWINKGNIKVNSFNVFSEGIHSRRSWIIYRNLFGRDYNIGIIAAYDPGYHYRHWWHSEYNIRHIIKESIGNIYFRFFKK